MHLELEKSQIVERNNFGKITNAARIVIIPIKNGNFLQKKKKKTFLSEYPYYTENETITTQYGFDQFWLSNNV